MNTHLIALLCLLNVHTQLYCQNDVTEITNEIRYGVDIQLGAKNNLPNLSDHERQLLLQTIRDGVSEGVLTATSLDPKTYGPCKKCTLTPEEFEEALLRVKIARVEDPETGEEIEVKVEVEYDLDAFIRLHFIEAWDLTAQGEFVKDVKAVGLNVPDYDDAGKMRGYRELCHVWFK